MIDDRLVKTFITEKLMKRWGKLSHAAVLLNE